jgi:8-oxo-dGTP pyrophosphatase MutT (NUDIX family)
LPVREAMIAVNSPPRGSSVRAVARRTMTAEIPSQTEVVQAAGGLVVRRHDGTLEIVVVHRPEHEDWSFPKGKLESGETSELAALREVREETGMTCRLLRFIGHTEYVDRKGRPKTVAYWVMAAEAGSFAPNEEVDELRWLNLESAARLLSYPRDRELVAVLMAADQVEPLV